MRLVLFGVVSIALAVPGIGVRAAAPATALTPGESMFREGSLERETATCGNLRCAIYQLKVAPGGARLRVAVDNPGTSGSFDVRLRDPSGALLGTADSETFASNPDPGIWTVEVIPSEESSDSFRVRAKLEDGSITDRVGELLLPNLRAEPGYDFGFSFVEPNCAAFGRPCDVAPVPAPPFCAPDETAEERAVRCLRFSFGYQNAGDGPMDLRFGAMDPVTRTAPIGQRIVRADRTPDMYSDNKFVERPAGSATYHEIHGHFHYNNIFGATMFKVLDERRGLVEPVGPVAKRGACAHDIVFVDFDRFFQDPQHLADSGSDCNFAFTDPTSPAIRIGLSAGWADIYPSALSDNYVDFGINDDGLYLVRVEADVDRTIDETNEKDNHAYSLIRITGFEVELLERGRGRDPWDPRKVVLNGLGD